MLDTEKVEALKEAGFTLAVCSVELRREWAKTPASGAEEQRRQRVHDSIGAAIKGIGLILLPLEEQVRTDYDGKPKEADHA